MREIDVPVHRIRLNGPWECRWRPQASAAGPQAGSPIDVGRVTMPATWESLFGRQAGEARFRRRFHRPTNLEPHERVWLVVSDICAAAQIFLNGESLRGLEKSESARFDITERLMPGNVAEIVLRYEPDRDSDTPVLQWSAVTLEIESTAS